MAHEERSPPKILEWIATNSFLKAVTKTPLRKSTTVGISGVVATLALHGLIPELRAEPTQQIIKETIQYGLAGFLASYALYKVRDAYEGLAKKYYPS